MDKKYLDPSDPDRHLHRLNKVVGVSTRIQSLATKRRRSTQIETKEERDKRLLVSSDKFGFSGSTAANQNRFHSLQKAARDERAGRKSQIGSNERYVLEIAAFSLDVEEEFLMECAADSAENIEAICELFRENSSSSLLVQYQFSDPPSLGKLLNNSGKFGNFLTADSSQRKIRSEPEAAEDQDGSVLQRQRKEDRRTEHRRLSLKQFDHDRSQECCRRELNLPPLPTMLQLKIILGNLLQRVAGRANDRQRPRDFISNDPTGFGHVGGLRRLLS